MQLYKQRMQNMGMRGSLGLSRPPSLTGCSAAAKVTVCFRREMILLRERIVYMVLSSSGGN